jgi:hypothetical protein
MRFVAVLVGLVLAGCPAEPPFGGLVPAFDASIPRFDASIPMWVPEECRARADAGWNIALGGPDAGRELPSSEGGTSFAGMTVCLEAGESFRIEFSPWTLAAISVSNKTEDPGTEVVVLRGERELARQSLSTALQGWFISGGLPTVVVLSRAPGARSLDLVDFNSGRATFGASGFEDWSFEGGVDPRQPTSDPSTAPVVDLGTGRSRNFSYSPLSQLGDHPDCEPRALEPRFFRFRLDAGAWQYKDWTPLRVSPHEVLIVGSDGGVLGEGAITGLQWTVPFTLPEADTVAVGLSEPDAGLVRSCSFDGGEQPWVVAAWMRRCEVARP